MQCKFLIILLSLYEILYIHNFYLFLLVSNAYALKNKHQFTSIESLKSNIEIKKLFKEKNTDQFILVLPNGTVINESGILTQKGYILQDT
ncbi:MAG: hypothetical protein O7C62_08600 [Rickettsia endosymbiont of Ixodes persulcatus]|nr:hypothetical protein [Rickettsia endosymbiont of Ixodes persulcatus]